MKTCPHCGKEIQDEAVKCRWCLNFIGAKVDQPFLSNALHGWHVDILKKHKIIASICAMLSLAILIAGVSVVRTKMREANVQKVQSLLKTFELIESEVEKNGKLRCERYLEGEKILAEIFNANNNLAIAYHKRAEWRYYGVSWQCKELQGSKILILKNALDDLQRERQLDPEFVKKSTDIFLFLVLFSLQKEQIKESTSVDNSEIFRQIDKEVDRIRLLQPSCDVLRGLSTEIFIIFAMRIEEINLSTISAPMLTNVSLYEALAKEADSNKCFYSDTDLFLSEYIYSEIVQFIRSQMEVLGNRFNYCSDKRKEMSIIGGGKSSEFETKCMMELDNYDLSCPYLLFTKAGCAPDMMTEILGIGLYHKWADKPNKSYRAGFRELEATYNTTILFDKNDYERFKMKFIKQHPETKIFETR